MELRLIGGLLTRASPKDLCLGLSLIYINDNISSQMRLFSDDSSLFTTVEVIGGVNQTHEKPIKDFQTITDWAHQ